MINLDSDGGFVLEALSEEEKYKWMLMIHFVKSRLEPEHLQNGSTYLGGTDSDFLIHATHIISQKSNKAIDQVFENMEKSKQKKKKPLSQ